MSKGKQRFLALLILLAIMVVMACVYLFAFKTLTIVSDVAYSQVLPGDLRLKLALKGLRLRIVQLSEPDFYDDGAFTDAMRKVKGNYVLLGPVSASYAVQGNIDVSSILPSSIVLAMTKKESSLFDCNLVSDERSGWLKAAFSVNSEISATTQNVALIYESGSIDYPEDIVSLFNYGRLTSFINDGSSNLFVRNSINEMDREHIVIALCPYLVGLDGFFSNPGAIKWIVDYRFVPAVPEANLYGVVLPSWDSLVNVAKGSSKDANLTVELEYDYEKR